MANSASGSTINRTDLIHPNIGRLILSGHSWFAQYNDGTTSPYQNTNPLDGARPRDQAYAAQMLRERFTPNAPRVLTFGVPAVAQASTVTTQLGLLPEDGVVEGVWYVPNATITGANTDTRKIEFNMAGGPLNTVAMIGKRQFDSGYNITGGFPQGIVMPIGADLVTDLYMGQGGTRQLFWLPSVIYPVGGTASRPNTMTWTSTAVGAGMADPGGTVHVRLGGRFRNLSQYGSRLMQGGAYRGGWSTQVYAKPWSRGFGIEVNCATTASTSATTIAVGAVRAPIANGSKIAFSGGVTATLTVAAAQADTVLTVSALSGGVTAGEQGWAIAGGFGAITAYEPLVPDGVNVMLWGYNDAIGTVDRAAWRETVRFVIAFACCPYWNDGTGANTIRAAGTGTFADQSQLANGRWFSSSNASPSSLKRFTGSVATPPTITSTINIPRDSAFIDKFFFGLCGTSRGVQGTISVDGGTAVNFDTSSISPTYGVSTATVVTATNTTVTGTGFDASLVGKVIEKSDIPKGTTVSSFQSSTSMTISAAATGGASGTATFVDWCPMVKRLTNSGNGYSAGAHTLVTTITAIDATDASAIVVDAGYGLEIDSAVKFCNIARTPGLNSDTAIVNYNTDIAAVKAGTAAMVGSNSTEPALGALVEVVDIDSALNHDAANFTADGVHLSSRGHQVLEATLTTSLFNLTSRQAIAR